MAVNVKQFLTFKSIKQVDYLKGGIFQQHAQSVKIQFLKSILKFDLPSITIACALRILRELHYPDRYYFRKYLYHIDSTVANAARKAINECGLNHEKNDGNIIEMLKEGRSDDRILLAEHYLQEEGKLNEDVLISFLSVEDNRVRERIVNKITCKHDMDEAVLSDTITRGSAWYVRAALVEILGKRKSRHLFDCIDYLLKDKNVEVKLKLIHALSNYEQEKKQTYLQHLALDSLIWVRKEAKRALFS
jgi:HEAT repeat protein